MHRYFDKSLCQQIFGYMSVESMFRISQFWKYTLWEGIKMGICRWDENVPWNRHRSMLAACKHSLLSWQRQSCLSVRSHSCSQQPGSLASPPLLPQELEARADDAFLTPAFSAKQWGAPPVKPFLTLCLEWWVWIFPLPCPSLSVNYRMELNQKIWYSLAISTKGFQSSVKPEMQEPQQLEK